MIKPTIEKYTDGETLAHQVAEWLTQRALATPDRFSIALSGGSTPQRLYEILATPEFASRFPWQRTHLFWGDERFVAHTDKDSNYRMTREALLDHVPLPPENIHPVPFSGEPADGATAYSKILHDYFGQATPGRAHPLFDVALMGLGEDGHTASLFPGSVALREATAWAVAVTDGGVKQPRVTLTYPVFAASRVCAFLVEGQRKASILAGVLGGDHRYPSARITALESLIWFTDEAAWHDPG
jgi:6-phosphogluconolactonase